MTGKEARALLAVQDPIEVAWTSKDGTNRDDDGDAIDERQLVPWVWALGPFGTWPVPVSEAEAHLSDPSLTDWRHHKNFRLGWCITWERGWGFHAVPGEEV